MNSRLESGGSNVASAKCRLGKYGTSPRLLACNYSIPTSGGITEGMAAWLLRRLSLLLVEHWEMDV